MVGSASEASSFPTTDHMLFSSYTSAAQSPDWTGILLNNIRMPVFWIESDLRQEMKTR